MIIIKEKIYFKVSAIFNSLDGSGDAACASSSAPLNCLLKEQPVTLDSQHAAAGDSQVKLASTSPVWERDASRNMDHKNEKEDDQVWQMFI